MKTDHTRSPLSTADALIGIGVTLAALAAYLPTLAPGLTWANQGADGGDLIAAAMTWGVPHPPGYPTWVLLGRLVALLPVGTVAWRFNLYSALAAAAAAGLVYGICRILTGREVTAASRALSATAALSFAFGYTLWSQAVIAEVYALTALSTAVLLYLALREDLAGQMRYWAVLGLSIGWGLGVHLTLVLTLPGIAMLCYPAWRESPRRGLVALLGVCAGLSVYGYLPLAGSRGSPVVWGQPADPAGFWWIVSGRLYQGYVFGLPLGELPARLSYWARLWGSQAGWHTLALSLLGALMTCEEDLRRGVALITTFVACTVYALGYATPDSTAYLIPAFLVAALWTARGLLAAWAWLGEPLGRRHGVRTVLCTALTCAVVVWPLAANASRVDASQDRDAVDWARHMVATLPRDAVVITGDDRHTFALSYFQWVEGERPDLLVVDGDLWNQPWYAAQVLARAGFGDLGSSAPLAELARRAVAQRPVALTTWRDEVAAGLSVSAQEGHWVLSAPRAGQSPAQNGNQPSLGYVCTSKRDPVSHC